MRIRIRILLFTLMQILIQLSTSTDPDLSPQNDADPDSDPQPCLKACGYGPLAKAGYRLGPKWTRSVTPLNKLVSFFLLHPDNSDIKHFFNFSFNKGRNADALICPGAWQSHSRGARPGEGGGGEVAHQSAGAAPGPGPEAHQLPECYQCRR